MFHLFLVIDRDLQLTGALLSNETYSYIKNLRSNGLDGKQGIKAHYNPHRRVSYEPSPDFVTASQLSLI